MKAAEPAQGEDGSPLEQSRGVAQCALTGGTRAARSAGLQPQRGPAGGATVGLGVVAAVSRSVILPLAVGALVERTHGGAFTVVGQAFDDGVAGAAVGAGDERISVAPVHRVLQLRLARRAETDIRRHREALIGGVGADFNPEGGDARRIGRIDLDGLDACQGWRLRPQCRQESRDGLVRPLDQDGDLSRGIADPAAEMVAEREPVNERAEAHALHDATHPDPPCDGRGYGGSHTESGAPASACRKAYQLSSPWPVRADVMKNCRSGFTCLAKAMA